MAGNKKENPGKRTNLYLSSEAIKVLDPLENKSVFASEAIIAKGKEAIKRSRLAIAKSAEILEGRK